MDFILKRLDKKIAFLKSGNNESELKVYLQARFEYTLLLMMAYLWNKNYDKLDPDAKEYIINSIVKPSIGDIVSIARKCDTDKEIFKRTIFNTAIENYPQIRNEKIGHGYVFKDGVGELNTALGDLYNKLFKTNLPILHSANSLIKVKDYSDGVFTGIKYLSNGSDYSHWQCREEVAIFDLECLYININDEYFKLSPFIDMNDEEEAFLFISIEEILTGRFKYNQLFKTNVIHREWGDILDLNIEEDENKIKSNNGTIINVFDNNYKKYIDVGVKREINYFLLKNKASVYATIWGHGGVGKTAAIQSCCEDLLITKERKFDYILFLSAKDRYYDFYQGKIVAMEEDVDSLSSIVQRINFILFGNESSNVQEIVNFQGKVLFVIDDFETFSKEERVKILGFINTLNINHHKVIITTRASNLISGVEINSQEFDKVQTKKFLVNILSIQYPAMYIQGVEKELENELIVDKLHYVTGGRPLFIFQVAVIIGQKGSVEETLMKNIKESDSAIDFLYGRIYDYLSEVAKDIFTAIGQITSENQQSNFINKLKFVVNLETKDDEFYEGINELVKLKIIEIIDDDFFKIYSIEIYRKMVDYFNSSRDDFKTMILERVERVTRHKDLDMNAALLRHADASRLTDDEATVEKNYLDILARENASPDIRFKALSHLAHYLINDIGKKTKAIKLFEQFKLDFQDNSFYITRYASYLWLLGDSDAKRKSISVLNSYLNNSDVDMTQEDNIKILAQLVQYRSMEAIRDREESKTKKQLREISEAEYAKQHRDQVMKFKSIEDNSCGGKLFRIFKNIDPENVSNALKQQVFLGLMQLIEVRIRLKKYEQADEVCDYIIGNFANRHVGSFISKRAKIKKYVVKDLAAGKI